jgi:hypothetical protein
VRLRFVMLNARLQSIPECFGVRGAPSVAPSVSFGGCTGRMGCLREAHDWRESAGGASVLWTEAGHMPSSQSDPPPANSPRGVNYGAWDSILQVRPQSKFPGL